MRMRRKKHLDERLAACDNLRVLESREFYMLRDKKADLIDLCGIFGNADPVELEIGCGKGKFIRSLAKLRPNTHFVAVEKLSNVIVSAAEAAKSENLDNLLFLNLSAENLELFIPPHSAAAIYLNFSCPFPKNSYANRRLTNPRFLDIYARLLHDGGVIRQKTDNKPFFEYSCESFASRGWKIADVKCGVRDVVTSEYEDRFLLGGFPIYALTAIPPDNFAKLSENT